MTFNSGFEYSSGYNDGYYEAGEAILHWMNSLDSSEMTVRDFRSALNLKILEMRPDYGCTATIESEEDIFRAFG